MIFWGSGRKLPIRGGNWDNGVRAGVFALNLNNARSNVSTNIGFRAALPRISSEVITSRGYVQHTGEKGPVSLP